MINTLCRFARLCALFLILAQIEKYFSNKRFSLAVLKDKSFFYDIGYLAGFNIFFLVGVFLILTSYAVERKFRTARDKL